MDEIFTLLQVDLFPKDNTLPKSLYQAKNIVRRLGFTYKSIHACYNGCVLFRGLIRVFVSDFLKRAKERKRWLNMKTHARDDREDLVCSHDVKRKSIFFQLPYWEVSVSIQLGHGLLIYILMFSCRLCPPCQAQLVNVIEPATLIWGHFCGNN